MVKLSIQKDLPCPGRDPEHSAEASPLQNDTRRKVPAALLVAATKWSEVAACSAEDTLGLIKEKNLTPMVLGSSQLVPAGARRAHIRLGQGAGTPPSGHRSSPWQGPWELIEHTGRMAPGAQAGDSPHHVR